MAGTAVKAQQIPLYSNYFFTPFIYNPAQSGSSGVTEASIIHRRQWSGIEGGPETSAITLNGALNREKVGYSVYAFTDRTDIVSRTGIYGSYAYHVRLSDENSLSFGLAGGYLNNNIDFDKIRVHEEYDPLLFPNLRRGNFDLNFGINLNIAGFQIGASVPQLLGAPIEYSSNYSGPVEYSMIRHFVFNAQYDWQIQGDKRVLSPIIMVRTAQNVPTQIDAGAIFNMKEYGYIGAMYRSDYSITANIGLHLTEQLSVGYAYDFSTNTYGSNFGTSHEIMLTYRFGSNRQMERLENDMNRMKQRQRQMQEDMDDDLRERFEEFKEEIEASNKQQLQEMVDGMTLTTPGQPQAGGQGTGGQGTGGQTTGQSATQGTGGTTGGNPVNTGGQPGGTNPRTGGGTQPGGSTTGGGTSGSGITGYPSDAMASSVEPGSPGYYVTAGVFGNENNARRLMQRLQGQGLQVNLFQDKVNNMYYVYLAKFSSYQAADGARSSNFNGQYDGRLWIKIVE